MVICLVQGADLHMAQMMPLPLTVSCFSINQIGITFLVQAHSDSPGENPEGRKTVVVVVVVMFTAVKCMCLVVPKLCFFV